MFESDLTSRLNNTNLKLLARSELGVAFNFESILPKLEANFHFLKFILDNWSDELTPSDRERVIPKINEFIQIRDSIIDFNPKTKDNQSSYIYLIDRANRNWVDTISSLREIFNYIKLSKINIEEAVSSIQNKIRSAEDIERFINEKRDEIGNLSKDINHRFNDTVDNIQVRISNAESRISSVINDSQNKIDHKFDEVQAKLNNYIEESRVKSTQAIEETEKKRDKALEDLRKFSAKETLVKYAQIFNNEAAENKKAIRKWECIFLLSIGIGVTVALSLFFWFLPEVVNLSKDLSSTNVSSGGLGVSWLVSILLVKLFILSIVAVGIGYTLKNLNAQNHLYSTNKFKANALASFQAFLDAVQDDPVVINEIILQVSKAVYNSDVSGYLSKDDSSKLLLKNLETFSKFIK